MHEWFKQCAKRIPGQVVMPQAGGGEAVRDQLMNVSDLRRRTPKHPTPSSKKYWPKHKKDMQIWGGVDRSTPAARGYRQQEWPCEAACMSYRHLFSALVAMKLDAAFTALS